MKLAAKACKFIKLLQHADYRRALRTGRVIAVVEHERLLKTLRCATVVDIGANRGQFAVVARHCFPQARILSFEPLAAPAQHFHNALGGDKLVTLQQVAIGDKPGQATIHVTSADKSSSLLPITNLQTSLYPDSSVVRSETVAVAPLDALVAREQIIAPALLKIDVQGYELNTLHGCQELLDAFHLVYVECSFLELYEGQALANQVCDFMSDHAFRLDGVYNVQYDSVGRAVQADFLFVNRSPPVV